MSIKLREARTARRWSQARIIHEIERYAYNHGASIATTASLRVYVSEWENGRRSISTGYATILRSVLGLTDDEMFSDSPPIDFPTDGYDELASRVDASRCIGSDMVATLDRQTELLRTMDRQIGAPGMVDQVAAHLANLGNILAFAVLPDARRPVARALAGAASMAAWQALDAGAVQRSWRHYELAKTAAREAEDHAHLAHAMGEQGYVLADAGKPALGAALVREARRSAGSCVPQRLTAWLLAAEAELSALAGQDDECRRLLDQATTVLPDGREARDGDLPNVFLNDWHLSRWRGHVLALLGDDWAISELYNALGSVDGTFVRAQAGLRCDLAQAHKAREENDAAQSHLREARLLANQTGSLRHRRRIELLAESCRFTGRRRPGRAGGQ